MDQQFEIVFQFLLQPVVNGEEALKEVPKPPKPLFGKGSGRGRKKTIVRLMQEAEQARQAKALLEKFEESAESLQQEVHSSVFTPSQVKISARRLHRCMYIGTITEVIVTRDGSVGPVSRY